MVAGSEIARMLGEFELQQAQTHSNDHKHHEQHLGVQVPFLVKSLVAVFEEMETLLWNKVKTF